RASRRRAKRMQIRLRTGWPAMTRQKPARCSSSPAPKASSTLWEFNRTDKEACFSWFFWTPEGWKEKSIPCEWTLLRALWLLVIFCICSVGLRGQETTPIRSNVNLVSVSFTARDARGALVDRLTQNDVEVLDEERLFRSPG